MCDVTPQPCAVINQPVSYSTVDVEHTEWGVKANWMGQNKNPELLLEDVETILGKIMLQAVAVDKALQFRKFSVKPPFKYDVSF